MIGRVATPWPRSQRVNGHRHGSHGASGWGNYWGQSLGQPAPADELIAENAGRGRVPGWTDERKRQGEPHRMGQGGCGRQRAGVHLPYYKRAENATAYATGVVEAMQARSSRRARRSQGSRFRRSTSSFPSERLGSPQSPQSPQHPGNSRSSQVAPGTPDQSPEAGKMVEPSGPVASFQTESGSTYTINGQSTTRDKADAWLTATTRAQANRARGRSTSTRQLPRRSGTHSDEGHPSRRR